MKFGKLVAVIAAMFVMSIGSAYGQDNATPAVSSGVSKGTKTEAVNSKPVVKTHDTGTWSTEGSGSCDTGLLTCASGRQIGCNATGDYVQCSYTYGDVGTVYCEGTTDGTTASYSDGCP